MDIQEILSRPVGFQYMLLSRLQSDCYSGGNMWGRTPLEHAQTMVAIYKNLKVKPDWLGLKELKALHYKLTKLELKEV